MFDVEVCNPIEHSFPVLGVNVLHSVCLTPFAKTVAVYKFHQVRVIVFFGKCFYELCIFLLEDRVIRIGRAFSIVCIVFGSCIEYIGRSGFIFSVAAVDNYTERETHASVECPLNYFFQLFVGIPAVDSFGGIEGTPMRTDIECACIIGDFHGCSFFRYIDMVVFLPEVIADILICIYNPTT